MDDPAKPKYKLLTVGDVLVDEFLAIPEEKMDTMCRLDTQSQVICFPYGQKVKVSDVEYHVGGNAGNNSVGMSRLGVKTALLSMVGGDWTAKIILDVMAEEGVGTLFIGSFGGAGGRGAVINYSGERSIFSYHPKLIYKVPQAFPEVEWIYLSSMGEGYEEMYKAVGKWKTAGLGKLALNPGTYQLADPGKWKELLGICDVLLVNREEAGTILGKTGETVALLDGLSNLGVKTAVITDGVNGAYAGSAGRHYHADILKVEVVERTGSGDAFGAGFLGAVMGGLDVQAGLKWGIVNSASVITKVGAQAGLLRKEEMDGWLGKDGGVRVEEL